MDSSLETTLLSGLAIAAFGLLIAVTLGVLYLTNAEWRDRRRQDQERRAEKRQRKTK